MTSDEEFRKCMEDTMDSICYCTFLNVADEIESCWFDCTHPQRPALICPYHQMKDCSIAVPDKEQQEIHINDAMRGKEFWDNERKNEDKKEHICDIDDDKLFKRHKNVLSLIGKYDPVSIGMLIAGKYYHDVWSSRSCSGTMAHLVGTDDYMDFYCGSSNYYFIKSWDNPIIKDFEEMDKLDKETK